MADPYDPFPPATRTPGALRDYRTALAVAECLGEQRLTILGWHSPPDWKPWLSFSVGEREFAIWAATGALHEVHEGAVTDEPISLEDLRP